MTIMMRQQMVRRGSRAGTATIGSCAGGRGTTATSSVPPTATATDRTTVSAITAFVLSWERRLSQESDPQPFYPLTLGPYRKKKGEEEASEASLKIWGFRFSGGEVQAIIGTGVMDYI